MFEEGMYFSVFYCLYFVKDGIVDMLEEQFRKEWETLNWMWRIISGFLIKGTSTGIMSEYSDPILTRYNH